MPNALFAQGATVVLKIMSRDIVHKSDVGGVVLNLTNADAVRKATADILARAKTLRPEARISGVIVQAMVVRPKARELILGLADDPTFGTVVVFGRGGTAVELINDKALALPPLDLQLARDLIERTRVSRLLRGYRDVPAVKQDAVAMVLVKLAQMAADIPEIRELDINPLLADEAGVLAVDARVVVGRVARKFRGSGPTNFAVRPYPSQWERHIEVKDGWRVFVRPIRPEDEPVIHEMLRHVTPEDLRLRFFAPMKEFTHEFIARLTQLDYARAMAFVAFDEASNELVGVVRIHSDSIYESGEYAILLRSDLKGRGLGWALMQLIIEYAKSEGLKVISGDVLAENTVMLAMCRNLGFEVKSDPDEHDICNVRLRFSFRLTCLFGEIALLERPPQPPDDHAARTFVGGSLDAVVDVEDELRHLVVPVQRDDRLWRQPPPAARVERRGTEVDKLVDVIKDRLEQHRGRNDPIQHTFGEAGDRLLLAMHQEQATSNRPARRDPSRQFRSVGVAGIIVDRTDRRRHLDFITLNSDRLGAVDEKPAKGSLGLETDQQHRRPRIPQPAPEMVPDPSGVAHAAGGDDDVKAGQLGDRLALVHGLGEAQMRRVEQAANVDRRDRGLPHACEILRWRGSRAENRERSARSEFRRAPSGRRGRQSVPGSVRPRRLGSAARRSRLRRREPPWRDARGAAWASSQPAPGRHRSIRR